MNFSDFDGVVSQEVMPLELQVTTLCVESKNLSVVVQELFLRWNTSSSEFLLQEFQELWVLLWWNWFARIDEGILWA
jgi:hypothetical protein